MTRMLYGLTGLTRRTYGLERRIHAADIVTRDGPHYATSVTWTDYVKRT